MGIDYGRGLVNIDHETGIRYGVISQHEVLQAWADESEPEYPCDTCDAEAGSEECQYCESIGCVLEDIEYTAFSDSMGDIFIIKSPYYTLCDYCSPCAPGAGDLSTTGNVKTYCFGDDWFDDGVAPYPIFTV